MTTTERSGCWIKWERRAQEEIIRVADNVEPRRVVEMVLSLYHLARHDRLRFRSDRAFLFELVRRLRCCTDMNVVISWDRTTGKRKRVYRDLAPNSAEHLGQLIAAELGASALYIADLDSSSNSA